MLVHLVDVSASTGRDASSDLDAVRRELELFDPGLASRPQLVAANKIDVGDAAQIASLERRAGELGLPFVRVSGVTGAGVADLLEAAWQRLAAARQTAA